MEENQEKKINPYEHIAILITSQEDNQVNFQMNQ